VLASLASSEAAALFVEGPLEAKYIGAEAGNATLGGSIGTSSTSQTSVVAAEALPPATTAALPSVGFASHCEKSLPRDAEAADAGVTAPAEGVRLLLELLLAPPSGSWLEGLFPSTATRLFAHLHPMARTVLGIS